MKRNTQDVEDMSHNGKISQILHNARIGSNDFAEMK